ncbi:hypothetical protein J591_1204 [Acinetobacter baumannii 532279]|uniref:hypothetical protein n=1 Tax=Acinetobacter baumannii TaxID=470 RepID=UPI00044740A3|nr:hypothetical protein [Acinetobacter baumannii]EXE89377.1 hypothetical protein J591_1204 [Acinetobacter baumannii 532279]
MNKLSFLSFEHIYLIGSVFELNLIQNDESLTIIMDGEENESEDLVFFKINFNTVATCYYEVNEMWPEEIEKKYDMSIFETTNWQAGVYKVENTDKEDFKRFDPLGRLNLNKFLIISQNCFCEIIARSEFNIEKIN